MILYLLKSLRPRQWSKNLLVFAGLLFTLSSPHPMYDIFKVCGAFVVFCLLSGAVYLVNDVLDIEKDRIHPKKRSRPIASGKLPVSAALGSAVFFAAVSLASAFYLDIGFGAAAATYLLLTTFYSLILKHIVIIDVLAIAAGFVLRAVGGALVIHVSISEWLLVCTTLLALFLGLAKRRNELYLLKEEAGSHRSILQDYTPAILDQLILITSSCSIMAYMLYTFLSKTGQGHRYMMMTIPFVMYGLFRYLYLVQTQNLGGSPESVLLEDKPLIVDILLWMVVVMVIMLATR